MIPTHKIHHSSFHLFHSRYPRTVPCHPCSNTALFPHAQCSASHIAASPSFVVALLVHCMSQPRAFTGKAAYCHSHSPSCTTTDYAHSVNGHRVLHYSHPHTVHSAHKRYLFPRPSVAVSQLQRISHIVQYHFIAFRYMPHISTLQVVYDVIFLVIMASIRCVVVLRMEGYGWQYFQCFLCLMQRVHCASSINTPCIIHSTSFYLFWWQPCGCICWHSRLEPDHTHHPRTSSSISISLSILTLISTLALISPSSSLLSPGYSFAQQMHRCHCEFLLNSSAPSRSLFSKA